VRWSYSHQVEQVGFLRVLGFLTYEYHSNANIGTKEHDKYKVYELVAYSL